jgi:chromosome segregation ATPase
MNLVNMLTRRDPLKRAFVTLEDGMSDVLNEEFMLPPEPGQAPVDQLDQQDFGDLDPLADELQVDAPAEAVAPLDQVEERFTTHTQKRLAGYAAFEGARTRTSEELGRISDALAAILSSNHISREFLNDCYADIHRANELEIANTAHVAENRRLVERLDKLERLRGRYDQLVDVLKRREVKLLQEVEAMREEIGTLKLESVESRSAIARHEAQAGDLQAALSTKSSEAERYMRDAELLRERIVGLSVDLDLAQKKQGEYRRRVEELTAVHASDSARLAEVTSRLTTEENETTRLQKLNDVLETRLVEANETAAQLSSEMTEREKRHQSEVHGLKAELQSVNSRLQNATGEHREAVGEVSKLRTRLSDLESDKHILEKKLAALTSELDDERRVAGERAEAAGSAAVDLHRRQTEQMRGEIAELQATVERLKQYESLYAAAKARARAKTEVANGFSVSNGKIVPEFEQAQQKQLARSA